MSDHVSDWRKSYCYQGTPIKDRDRVYLKCYAGGDAGYVARYEHTTPSSTTLVQMQGASRVEIKDAKSVYYATWTPESFKAQNAFQFIAHVKDGHIWFESDILGGHQEVPREMISMDKNDYVFYVASDPKDAYVEFSGARHMGFESRVNAIFATKEGGRWYLNSKKAGVECVFVPEKV